jgi:hypothetical protein
MSLRILVVCPRDYTILYIVNSILDLNSMRLLQLIFLASLDPLPGTEGDGKHLRSPLQLVEDGRIFFFPAVWLLNPDYYLLLVLVNYVDPTTGKLMQLQ